MLSPMSQAVQGPKNTNTHLMTWVTRHPKDKTIPDFNESRDDGMAVTSAGPVCKSPAPYSKQKTKPAPLDQSILHNPDAIS